MYRQLARWYQEQAIATIGSPSAADLQNAAMQVFEKHPLQLARFLDEAWFASPVGPAQRPSLRLPVPIQPQLDSFLGDDLRQVLTDIYPLVARGVVVNQSAAWHHLIYAYMIENTRVLEIVRRVLHEYLHDEALDVPSVAGQHWLRAVEDLFFKDTPPYLIHSLTSWIRPNIDTTAQNAYFRMFAMLLNHVGKDGLSPQVKAKAANVDFVPTFVAWLREVWRGIENFTNTSGPNSTDDTGIANLSQQLCDMLGVRRRNGNLSREEFFLVARAEFVHLTLEFNSPIVVDLKAEATSPEERLRKMGERVGVPAHVKSESFFLMAEPLSRILISLERGVFNTPSGAQTLYAQPPGTPNTTRDDMMTIITQWSIATDRDIKAKEVAVPSRATALAPGR
ncbi:hypothetical protein [Pseudonocardia sp. T1-2H]|uniref:hypothetical protein n=1 Tax=Pseudonocardia sp. T1-2H TaxID=3128899 RepID=UPI003100FBDE